MDSTEHGPITAVFHTSLRSVVHHSSKAHLSEPTSESFLICLGQINLGHCGTLCSHVYSTPLVLNFAQ